MKLTTVLASATLLLFSSAASADFFCTDIGCNVKWKSQNGAIILGSVCQDYRYKPEFKACKKAAKAVFTRRCTAAINNKNRPQENIYCPAARNFRP
ncbi:MAG TPA: hypothetical protein ENK35_05045 [Candidatus Tenderia sp.]|nr:hypothetical protein [Candidatus Tenderia sp.]